MSNNEFSNEEIEQLAEKLLSYVDILRNNGAMNMFSQLFQYDYRILSYLKDKSNVHPSIMASDLNITRPNVAANLRILEQKKYITRVTDELNRRQVYVNITANGKRYLNIVDNQCILLFSSWLNILGRDEVVHLLKILEISSNPNLISSEVKNFTFGD